MLPVPWHGAPCSHAHGDGRLVHLHPHGLDITEDLLLVAGQGHSYSQQIPVERKKHRGRKLKSRNRFWEMKGFQSYWRWITWVWDDFTIKHSRNVYTPNITALYIKAQFLDGYLEWMKTHSLERGLSNACCFALQRDCINATKPQAYFFNKICSNGFTFSHIFILQATLLIKINGGHYLCRLELRVLWEQLSWPNLLEYST